MGLRALLLVHYWLVQGLRHGKYLSSLGERLGFSFPALAKLSADSTGAIWIHAVSVGEVLSGITLARRLKETSPNRSVIISTTTQTGQALARERMPFADAVIYFPLDWAFCVRRALDAVRPSVVLVLETEIWPNFLRESGRRKIPVLFVSGRISGRSFARYQRYLGVFGFFLRPFLTNALSNASAFLMMSEPNSSMNRTASSYGGRDYRFRGRDHRKLSSGLIAPAYPMTSLFFSLTASVSWRRFMDSPTVLLSEARLFLPGGTIFWSRRPSAKYPFLAHRWKILRK